MSDAMMLGPMPEDEATLAFLRMVLPEEGLGHYVVAIKTSKGMQHVFVKSLAEVAHTLFDVDRSGYDCYYATACYAANTSRSANNAVALKSLRLDIDVGKGDGSYATTQDAAVELAKFCHATGLPRPIVVESGSGGLHVYWPLKRALPPDQWKPYADGLKRACTQRGLLADSVCTSDVARILRAPGTHNRKKPKDPKKVVVNFLREVQPYPLETFDSLLSVDNVVPLKPATLPSTLGPMPAHLLAGALPALAPSVSATTIFAPAYGSIVATKCAQLAAMRDLGGVMPEPEWRACLGVLAFCRDGEQLAQEWSQGDTRYDPAETQRKLDACRNNNGPITCAHFRGLNSRCAGCAQGVVTPKTLGESLFDPSEPAEAPAAPSSSPFVTWEKSAGGVNKRASIINATLSLKIFSVVCRFDVFHRRATVQHPDLAIFGEKFCDAHTRALRVRMISEHDHDPGFDTCWQAIKTQCERNQYDPIKEYLETLRWDGSPRIDNWLRAYLGADNTPLNRAFGRKTLLAAVRRVHQPGAKFDFMLVLEGSQGTGKSSAARILAGDDNFSDQKLLHLDTKAQAEQIAGKWIYEISELAGLHGRAVEDVKQFIARQSDEARPAYGREVEESLRRCIFIGTTNNNKYLHDETGNRRFWPVRTGVIDLDALARDRDQLWAEAQHYASKGESLGLDPSLWSDAGRIQEERRQEDPWEEVLRGVVGREVEHAPGEFRITSTELFFAHLKMTADKLTTGQSKRLSTVMHTLGWTGPRTLRIEGDPVRGYFRTRPRT